MSFADAVGPAAFVTYIRAILLRDTGATISPFNAFLLLQGVETLSLRLERHAENTKKVMEYLAHHPQVEHVNHPSLPEHPDHALYEKYFPNGGASIFTFNIKGGQKEAHKFIDSLKIFSLLANVADVKSLVIHPATTTHSQLTDEELADQGIAQNTIRLSITARRREIAIMRLVGASNGFIRGPFITEGVLQAILGSLLSIGVLELLRNLMIPRLQESIGWMSFALPMQYYLVTYAALILVGVIIGLFGSAIAMRRYLRV